MVTRKKIRVACKLSVPALIALLSAFLCAQNTSPQPQSDQNTGIDWRTTPVAVAPEPIGPDEVLLRNKRSGLFKDQFGTRKRLDSPNENGDGIGYGSAVPFHTALPALPFLKSDTVVVATITGFQPFLSGDKTRIYTELKANIEQPIKSEATLVAGQELLIPQIGGTLKLGDGRVVTEHQTPDPENAIDVGHRYLLFLRHRQNVDYYSVVKIWELRDGKAEPQAISDVRDAKNGKSLYAGLTESDFLRRVLQCAQPAKTDCSQQ